MKRALPLTLVLLLACAGSPPATTPSVSGETSAKPAEKPEPERWIELADGGKTTLLIGRGPDGSQKYRMELRPVVGALGTPDGGAIVAVEEETKYSPGKAEFFRTIIRFDAQGHIEWKLPITGGHWDFRFVLGTDKLIVFDLVHQNWDRGAQLFVLDRATGALQTKVELPERTRDAASNGEVFVIAGDDGIARVGTDGKTMWRARLREYPTLRSRDGGPSEPRRIAVAADGTILTGASDGSLVAFDPSGKALYQLGVRGQVTGIDARPNSMFAVRTSAGLTTIIGPAGQALSEMPTAADSASATPQRLKDLRKPKEMAELPKSRTAVPFRPTGAYRVEKQAFTRRVRSVVAVAPGDVWVLGLPPVSPQSDNFDFHLFHYDGKTFSDLGAPTAKFPKEPLAEGTEPVDSHFFPRRLALGPKGALMVLGYRDYGGPKRPTLLERSGNTFRERREVFEGLFGADTTWQSIPTYAVSPTGREIFCDSSPRMCIELGAGVKTRRFEESELGTIEGMTDRFVASYDTSATPLLFVGEAPKRALAFSNGNDIWGMSNTTLVRWDGKAATRWDAPVRFQSVWASGRDDVWLGSAEGVGRFDGERFYQLAGLPKPTSGEQFVTGAAKGDIWVYGEDGLWHVTADPNAGPDIEGTLAPPPPAAAGSTPLSIAGADTAYRLEKVVIDVDGQRPLQRAIHVAAAPDGALWFHEGARIVEYDGTKARVLYQSPKPAPFYCWYAPEPDCNLCSECTDREPHVLACERCSAPAGAGQGVFITPDAFFSVKGGRPDTTALPLFSVTSVAAGPSGSFWAVSASDDELPHAVTWGAKGKQLVSGLPPAAYTDVSMHNNGEVWLAGGLTSMEWFGPAAIGGEGTLVGFDGKAFARYRAPDGALLSVAATAPGEAWAVGLKGSVVHVQGGKASSFSLQSEGPKDEPAVILRQVSARGPSEVWIAGDRSHLLRWDGKAFYRIDTSLAGKTAALSSVLAPTDKPGWVTGPSGIFKIIKK